MTKAKRRKKARLAKNARIAIVGGGMGGLGAAISLQKEGFTNVIVYERDLSPEPTAQNSTQEGYGLTLSYNPKGPLAHMGILEEVARQDCPSRSHYIFKPDGSVLGYYGNAFLKDRGLGQRGNLRVPRQVLRRILLKQVTKVQWGKRLDRFDYSHDEEKIQLYFDDGTVSTNIELLVGADGLRSPVVQTLLAHKGDEKVVGLRYLGVMIILGISNVFHPLLDERGFYTVDGEHRLFTMPYEGSKLDDEERHEVSETCSITQDTTSEGVRRNGQKRRRIMWQLSCRLQNESEAKRMRESGPQALRDEVLRRCKSWHKPVVEMVQSTPLETIWGTGLMDRDPEELIQQMDPRLSSRVVVLGDAAHSMSPFKGQGANQALLDGPLLTSWLLRASAQCAVRGFMREMAVRTGAKVRASRQAALMLHSPQVLLETQNFVGVQQDSINTFLEALRERNINAGDGQLLDDSIREVIEELDVGVCLTQNNQHSITTSDGEHKVQDQALTYSAQGNTVGLRNLSLQHSNAIRCAQDKQKRTCLHLAALGGHYHCCRWLLAEAFVPHNALDAQQSTPLQAAIMNGDESVIALLSARSNE